MAHQLPPPSATESIHSSPRPSSMEAEAVPQSFESQGEALKKKVVDYQSLLVVEFNNPNRTFEQLRNTLAQYYREVEKLSLWLTAAGDLGLEIAPIVISSLMDLWNYVDCRLVACPSVCLERSQLLMVKTDIGGALSHFIQDRARTSATMVVEETKNSAKPYVTQFFESALQLSEFEHKMGFKQKAIDIVVQALDEDLSEVRRLLEDKVEKWQNEVAEHDESNSEEERDKSETEERDAAESEQNEQ